MEIDRNFPDFRLHTHRLQNKPYHCGSNGFVTFQLHTAETLGFQQGENSEIRGLNRFFSSNAV